MEKSLTISVDKNGFVSVPLSDRIKDVFGQFISFYQDEKGPQIVTSSRPPTAVTIQYHLKNGYTSITVFLETLSDDIGLFEKIDMKVIIQDSIIAIRYNAYLSTSVIQDTFNISLNDEDGITISYDNIPYSISVSTYSRLQNA
jgi:hypothetical protein